jgi:hypothetical protein
LPLAGIYAQYGTATLANKAEGADKPSASGCRIDGTGKNPHRTERSIQNILPIDKTSPERVKRAASTYGFISPEASSASFLTFQPFCDPSRFPREGIFLWANWPLLQ